MFGSVRKSRGQIVNHDAHASAVLTLALLRLGAQSGLEEDFLRSRLAGCDRHLVKPVDLQQLRFLLANYAETARREREPEALAT